MRLSIFIICLFSSFGLSAEQYVCLADQTVGFSFSSSTGGWQKANFRNDDNKYIISTSESASEAYKIIKVGEKTPQATCKDGFNEPGYLFCAGFGGDFKINKNNGRYIKSYTLGYYNVLPRLNGVTDENSDTPLIEIGKCSPL